MRRIKLSRYNDNGGQQRDDILKLARDECARVATSLDNPQARVEFNHPARVTKKGKKKKHISRYPDGTLRLSLRNFLHSFKRKRFSPLGKIGSFRFGLLFQDIFDTLSPVSTSDETLNYSPAVIRVPL